MCGIAGILNRNEFVDPSTIRKMTDAMSHRGPDSDGCFVDGSLGLGNRRLSIIDLSDAANQPFEDASGRYVMVYNGEIYNYADIRARFGNYSFRSSGDTEVLLDAYIQWGPSCLGQLRGMFTFAVWDKQERSLFIARDPLGVKPLYYFQDNDRFIFGSEIRTILASGFVQRKVDRAALTEYFRYQSIGYPFSAVEGIRQMEAGSWIKIREGVMETKRYWDPVALPHAFDYGSEKIIKEQVRALMLQSVKRRLVSDVPVGAFLSGGIDSSAVVGLMVEAGDGSPNTFNIAFDEKKYDESQYAELVAKKFNTRHTCIRLKPEVMLEELTHALDAMDTPTGDGINTYVVSKAISEQGMRVALSGVGGDELFAGYPIFSHFLRLQKMAGLWKVPGTLRKLLSSVLGPGAKKDRVAQFLQLPDPSINNVYPLFRQLLSPEMIEDMTRLSLDYPDSLQEQLTAKKDQFLEMPLFSQVSAAEYMGYTANTLLKDTDQFSMAVSLEAREPFFDQDLVEFVMHIPDDVKKPVYPKSLLVESLKPLIPNEVVFRKKQGFVFPWEQWMKHELRAFCSKHIDLIAQRDFINGESLKETWTQFLLGNKNVRWQEMWLFIVLEYWMNKNQMH